MMEQLQVGFGRVKGEKGNTGIFKISSNNCTKDLSDDTVALILLSNEFK